MKRHELEAEYSTKAALAQHERGADQRKAKAAKQRAHDEQFRANLEQHIDQLNRKLGGTKPRQKTKKR